MSKKNGYAMLCYASYANVYFVSTESFISKANTSTLFILKHSTALRVAQELSTIMGDADPLKKVTTAIAIARDRISEEF